MFKVSLILCIVVNLATVAAFQPLRAGSPTLPTEISSSSSSSFALRMGFLDQISKAFLQEREGDFIKLEDSGDSGLGPALLLYNVPAGIVDDEVRDMLEDGAPQATKAGVALQRIPNMNHPLLELTLKDALQKVLDDNQRDAPSGVVLEEASASIAPVARGNPVLLFSGFANAEMMATYNIIAGEIYAENGSQAACAKAVPNALSKPLRQVVEEISGDHQDALEMESEVPKQ